jgi:uncharacterized protein with von Willebrand factor type A (vWA) domain
MLGRMNSCEKELEEEFMNQEDRVEWIADHAGKSDLIGVRESDDLGSMLPAESALLGDETLQMVFFKRYTEKKLQTYEYQAKMQSFHEEQFLDTRVKEESKGPFIICVDTSGSMHGTPEAVAKALSLAILKIAMAEDRLAYLISFSTRIETLELTDLKNSLDKIIQFLSMSFHGGTDAVPALYAALNQIEKEGYKKADVIFVSDFITRSLGNNAIRKMQSARESGTKFHSLEIGYCANHAVTDAFDNNWFYSKAGLKSILSMSRKLRN